MHTWLDQNGQHYADRVRLLVEILPALASEQDFALKGGTAINLFEHDLPRLSVDIDLTWLPVHNYATDERLITEALRRLAGSLQARPMNLQVQTSLNERGAVNRLVVSRARARVHIETTPVMRGTVHPVRRMRIRPSVEEAFGFAEVQVLDFADLYAGKLAAALSRQHPRDLFDIGLLLQDPRANVELWRTFLVYLTCSPKPAWEILAPRVPSDFEATFNAHFRGMTSEPIEVATLLESRDKLLGRIAHWLDEPSRRFLQSVEEENPDFGLIERAHAAEMPGVRRKLQNLEQRTAAKRAADRRLLDAVLTRIAGAK